MAPFFLVIKYLTSNKRPWNKLTDEEKQSVNVFLLHRYLSMNQNYIELVNYVQGLNIQDKEKIYKIYYDLIPTSNVWLKYIKSTSKNTNKELLTNISLYYNCSQSEASEYVDFLGKDGIQNILESIGLEDKEIKKTLKEIK